jgi:hypothetical protein
MKEIGGENEITNFRYHMPFQSRLLAASYAYGSSHYYLLVIIIIIRQGSTRTSILICGKSQENEVLLS